MASRREQRERARQERLAAEQAAAAQAARSRRLRLGGAAALVIAVVAVVGVVLFGGSSGSGVAAPKVSATQLGAVSSLGRLAAPTGVGSAGPEGIPVPVGAELAPPRALSPGQSVDGISCSANEQTVFHVHTHLTIYVDGVARKIPYGVGIGPPRHLQNTPAGAFVDSGSCFSWLHTHAADGVIHIESPVQRRYTLGEFFDIWGLPLSATRVGPARGRVTAFYDGHHYLGNPRSIPLGDHVQIQLDVGRPLVAPVSVRFPSGL